MSSRRHRHPFARRGLAAFAAMVLVLGSLASFAHEAMVAHTTCVEHGERVHTAALGTGEVTQDGTTAVRGALRGEAGEAEDHCTLCPATHAQGITETAASAGDAPAMPAPADALPAETPRAARPIYSLAPKHGPPTFA